MHKFGKCCFAGIVIPRVPTSGEENWLSLSMRIESVYYKHGCFVYKFSRRAALVGVGWRDWWDVANLNAGGIGSSVTVPHKLCRIRPRIKLKVSFDTRLMLVDVFRPFLAISLWHSSFKNVCWLKALEPGKISATEIALRANLCIPAS